MTRVFLSFSKFRFLHFVIQLWCWRQKGVKFGPKNNHSNKIECRCDSNGSGVAYFPVCVLNVDRNTFEFFVPTWITRPFYYHFDDIIILKGRSLDWLSLSFSLCWRKINIFLLIQRIERKYSVKCVADWNFLYFWGKKQNKTRLLPIWKISLVNIDMQS